MLVHSYCLVSNETSLAHCMDCCIERFMMVRFDDQAAAACYIDLIVKESDNNVKLIVVGRLGALREVAGEGAARALPDLAMDVLRVLASSDLDVRKHTLQLGNSIHYVTTLIPTH